MRWVRQGRRGQEGSALIIALVFVTAIGLLVAAILSFSEAGLRASSSYRASSKTSYAADGATAAAIMRYGTTGPCDSFKAPPINEQGVIVRCQGPPPAGSKGTEPLNSLLSLGTDTTNDGISSSQELHLLGDVYSTTKVSTSATMVVQGQVSAVGTCTGPIQTAPPDGIRCATTTPSAASTADRSRGRDPDYTKATNAVPMRRDVPGCPAGWLVTLDPGYYDDAAGLSALTTGGCSNRVLWFRPGTYYVDLTFRGGTAPWTVTDPTVTVVGGTPKGWDPAADQTLSNRPPIKIPGSCKTETDAPPNDGVQVIAGGGTKLQIDRGRMELCATPSATDQQIALFGLRPELATHTLEATSITGVGFTDALHAQTLDETPVCGSAPSPCPLTARADLGATTPSASLAFSGFRPAVPPGTLIDGASLVVKHREDGNVSPAVTVTADFPGTPGSACGPSSPQAPAASPGAISETRIDLKVACLLRSPEDLAALAVTYAATLGPGGSTASLHLDGVVLEVNYRVPTTRKPTAFLGASGFTNPESAFEIGEQPDRRTADAALGGSGPTSASLTLAGLGDPLPTLPSIDSAVLRVAHQDKGAMDGPTVTVAFPGGTCTSLPVPHQPGAITDDRIDLTGCGLTSPAKLKGLTATFTASLNPASGATATSRLDGMWLEVVSSDTAGPAGPQAPSLRRAKSASATGFANTGNAMVIGEDPTPVTADADMSGPTNSAALTVGDFSSIPLAPGSTISQATLRVRHQEDANVESVGAAATVPSVPGYPGSACPASPVVFPNSTTGLASDEIELTPCGLRSPDQLAGLVATYSATRKATPSAATHVPTGASGDGFSNAAAGGAIGGGTADANLGGTNPDTAKLTLTDYSQAGSPIPAGSTIQTATLRVAHQEGGTIGAPTATVTFPNSTCTPNPALGVQTGAIGVDTVDLSSCGLTDPAQLAGFRVVYQADLAPQAPPATDQVDGVELVLTYRLPAVDKLDGIELDLVFQAPTFTPLCGTCDLISMAPNAADAVPARFVASGTVFAPSAGFNLRMFGIDTQVLSRGLIGRSIHLELQPTPAYKRPTGAIPPEVVTFTAYPDRTLAPATVTTGGFTSAAGAKATREGPCPPAPPCPPPPTADAALDATTTTASLELKGFGQTGLPSSPYDAAVLRIRHEDHGNTLQVTVQVGSDAPCVDHQVLAPNPTTLTGDGPDGEDQIELPASCRLSNKDNPSSVSEVTVTYDVALDAPTAATATAKLDGITLDVLSGALLRARVTFDRAKPTVKDWSVLR